MMNMLAQAIAAQYGPEVATYGWIITKDHLAECEGHESTDGPIGNVTFCDGTCNRGEAGTSGPSNISAELLARLKAGEGDTFRMYDDDGILYYTGKGLSTEDWDEDACYGPLGDFGMPNAGAVLIKWHGHPERDCG